MRARLALAPILGIGLFALSCTSVVGAGVVAVAGGAAVLASDCPNLLDITVRDGVTGARTCEATVVAVKGDEVEQVKPCYHANLADGTWQIRASFPGRADELSTVVIARKGKCVHTVQTVELWLRPMGQPALTQVQPSAPLPAAPPPPGPAPAAPPSGPPPAAAPPASAPAPPASAPAAPAPAPTAVPPSKTFPDRPAP
jgi:hypothetical protein